MAQANWRPAEDDQGRPGTPLCTASLRLRTIEEGLGELAQDRRAWNASVRDVVNSIGDAGSTHPGGMPTQVQVSKYPSLAFYYIFTKPLNMINYVPITHDQGGPLTSLRTKVKVSSELA